MTRLPDAQNSYAVLIGTSEYANDFLEDLPAVRNNVNTLATLLGAPSYCGIASDHCITMHNRSGTRETYRELIGYAKAAEDTLIIYFAGHSLTGPRRHELYLCLADTEPDESQLSVNALSIEQIHKAFECTPASNRILILDCCYSGRAARDFMASYDDLLLGQVEVRGGYTMAATPANSTALAPPGALYTAFTGELIQLIRNGLPNGPRLLTLDSIFRRLLYVTRTKDLPEPRQRGSDTAHLLALSKNIAYKGAEKPERETDNDRKHERETDNDCKHEELKDFASRARRLRESGEHIEAAQVLRQLVTEQNRLLGPNDPQTLGSKQDLAFALNAAGDIAGASRILRQLFETQLFQTSPEEAPPEEAPYHLAVSSITDFWSLAPYLPLFVTVFLFSGVAAHLPSDLGVGNYAALVLSTIVLLVIGGIVLTVSVLLTETGWEKAVIGLTYLGCALAGYLPALYGQPWLWTGHIVSILRDWLVWRF